MTLNVRSSLVIVAASVAGLLTLGWPLISHGNHVQPPYVYLGLVAVIVLVALVQLTADGVDARLLALLGILAALDALLRGMSAGTGGVELVFFLLILGGRAYGAAFGFMLGSVSLIASALLTAGVGPWLPYQMLVSAWIGCGAGLLPRVPTHTMAGRRIEIAMLVVYGVVVSYLYGLLLNLQGWATVTGFGSGTLQFDPHASLGRNLVTFVHYTLVTSTATWDTGRAITTALALALLGSPVLRVLRRHSPQSPTPVRPQPAA